MSPRCSARSGAARPITVHNYYVPAGGDEPDPEINPKFAHKLDVPRRNAPFPHMRPARPTLDPGRRSQRRAARTRRLESQGDAQGRLAHADRMREAHRRAQRPANGSMPPAPSCRNPRSSTPGGAIARRPTGAPPTGAAGSTTSGCRSRSATGSATIKMAKEYRGCGAAVRSRAGDGDARVVKLCVTPLRRAGIQHARARRTSRPAPASARVTICSRKIPPRPDSLPASCGTGCAKCGSRSTARVPSRWPADGLGDQRQFAQQRARADDDSRRPARCRLRARNDPSWTM